MTVSRRNVLLQGCAIGAGVIATQIPGVVALAQGRPPQRLSLGDDPLLIDPIVQAWRDGVAQLKLKPAADSISWANFAAIHGKHQGPFNLCSHRNWYFLPWHRAFLLMYERTVRELTGHSDFALPYWDWTENRQLPAAFSQPLPNPLLEARLFSPTDSLPDEIVGPAVVDTILGQTDFETFGTSRPIGQDSLAQSWIKTQSGTSGTLEATPHNLVHGRVGGAFLFGGAGSALDPIFMMHHCNIDRIWAVWNVNNPNSDDPLWTDMTFQNNFHNPDGSFYSPTVSELFTPETLGYTYGLELAPAAAAAPAIVALGEKMKTLYATPKLSSAAGIKTFTAPNLQQATATAAKPLDIAVEVDRSLMVAVARRAPAGAGRELLSFNIARERAASGPHALAFIRDIAVTQHENTLYRVFIDCDYLSQGTPISDPHYIGTFGIFGDHEGHGGKPAAKPSIVLDLTRAIKRVYGSATELTGRIRVQILPVPNTSTAGPAGTAAPGRIEVAFVPA